LPQFKKIVAIFLQKRKFVSNLWHKGQTTTEYQSRMTRIEGDLLRNATKYFYEKD